MMVLPCLSLSTSPASRSTAKWADIVGLETGKCSARSPANWDPGAQVKVVGDWDGVLQSWSG